MSNPHLPVMLDEARQLLSLRPGMTVVDATLGCGGHASAILKEIGPRGILIGFEWDSEALEKARAALAGREGDARLHRAGYTELESVLAEEGVSGADALLFDLGVSSLQLASAARGFSFRNPGPLDMRMDDRRTTTAASLLRRGNREEIERVLRMYGEEPLARRIARELVRRGTPRDTGELAAIVSAVYRRAGRKTRTHPATRVFQALRIAVNEELANLKTALPQAVDVARSGARIVVISFHSLEDRIVKEEFSRRSKGCTCPPDFPVCRCGKRPELKIITKKPLRPTEREVESNPRARSARLRAAEKI